LCSGDLKTVVVWTLIKKTRAPQGGALYARKFVFYSKDEAFVRHGNLIKYYILQKAILLYS
jgi:hypothetical protein